MRSKMLLGLALAAMLSFAVSPASAQELTAEWAEPMMGSWVMDLSTPDGVVPVRLSVREMDSAVVVVLGGEDGEAPPITDVRRRGDSLVASYEMDYQGMMIDAEIEMTPEGSDLQTEWSFAEGMYVTTALGKRPS